MRLIIPDHQHREGDEDSEKDVDPGDNEHMYAYVSQGRLPEKNVYHVRGNVHLLKDLKPAMQNLYFWLLQ